MQSSGDTPPPSFESPTTVPNPPVCDWPDLWSQTPGDAPGLQISHYRYAQDSTERLQQLATLAQGPDSSVGWPCLWLCSSWPHFKPGHYRDIIAGGFIAEVRADQAMHTLLVRQDLLPAQRAATTQTPLKNLTNQLQVVGQSQALPRQWLGQQLFAPAQPGLPQPGWYGGLSYHYNWQNIGLAQQPRQQTNWPSCSLNFASWVLCFDHQTQQTSLIAINLARQADLDFITDILQPKPTTVSSTKQAKGNSNIATIPGKIFKLTKAWQPLTSEQAYHSQFEAIQSALRAGDAYQVNLTQAWQAPYSGSPLYGFIKANQSSPSPYAAYWHHSSGALACHSPELLIASSLRTGPADEKHTIRIETKPIKGTIKRGATDLQDQQLAIALTQCPKNRRENTMIVDLLRNDLSKVAKLHSLKVPKLCALKTYAHYHHLVSTVQCETECSISPLDTLLACFPGGSITGAPKRSSMQLIDELETIGRDMYCGSIGYWDQAERSEFNIAIRTLLFARSPNQPPTVHAWAGGGIVLDSTAQDEQNECLIKIKPLLASYASDSEYPYE